MSIIWAPRTPKCHLLFVLHTLGIKSVGSSLEIGTMFITNEGKLRIWSGNGWIHISQTELEPT